MNSNKLISVIIPAYNVENYIERCVNSVICQTYTNIQIIIVDDGSTDDTGVVCRKMAEVDNRITVIRQHNMGLSVARNTGLDHAKGEYIAFLDSDDWVEPNMYEILLKNAVAYKCSISSCDSRDIIDGVPIHKEEDGQIEIYDIPAIIAGLLSKQHMRFEVWNKLWEADLIKEIRFIPKQVSEDIYFDRCTFMKAKRIVHINRTLHNYVNNRPGNTNSSFRIERINALNEFEAFAECLESDGYKKESHIMRALLIRYLMSVYMAARQTHQNKAVFERLNVFFKNNYRQIRKEKDLNKLSMTVYNISPNLYYVIKRLGGI